MDVLKEICLYFIFIYKSLEKVQVDKMSDAKPGIFKRLKNSLKKVVKPCKSNKKKPASPKITFSKNKTKSDESLKSSKSNISKTNSNISGEESDAEVISILTKSDKSSMHDTQSVKSLKSLGCTSHSSASSHGSSIIDCECNFAKLENRRPNSTEPSLTQTTNACAYHPVEKRSISPVVATRINRCETPVVTTRVNRCETPVFITRVNRCETPAAHANMYPLRQTINHEECLIQPCFNFVGVIETDPEAYKRKYHSELITYDQLPPFIQQLKPPKCAV